MELALLVFFLSKIFHILVVASSSMVHPVRFIHRDIEGPSITRLMKAHNPFTMRYLTQYEPYESNYSIKLRGSTDLGYYYATVFVGSPPQKQTVIVDTGSSVSAIPCKRR